jgi:hypothetical protein
MQRLFDCYAAEMSSFILMMYPLTQNLGDVLPRIRKVCEWKDFEIVMSLSDFLKVHMPLPYMVPYISCVSFHMLF